MRTGYVKLPIVTSVFEVSFVFYVIFVSTNVLKGYHQLCVLINKFLVGYSGGFTP